MADSLLTIAFDHRLSCPSCDLPSGKVCPEGNRLFQAALEKLERLTEPPMTEAKCKA